MYIFPNVYHSKISDHLLHLTKLLCFFCCCCDDENIKVLLIATFKYTVVLLTIAIMLFLRFLGSVYPLTDISPFPHPSAFQIFSCVISYALNLTASPSL